MRKFRVVRKEDKIVKRRVIKQVAAYKYIPRHAYHFLFEHGIFCEQIVGTLKKCFLLYFILKGHRMPSL